MGPKLCVMFVAASAAGCTVSSYDDEWRYQGRRLNEAWSVDLPEEVLVADTNDVGEVLAVSEAMVLSRISTGGNVIDTRQVVGTDPIAVHLGRGADGRFAVVSRDAGTLGVALFARESAAQVAWTVTMSADELTGVALDASGAVWVAADGQLLRLNADGTPMPFETGAPGRVDGVFGGDGFVYAFGTQADGTGWLYSSATDGITAIPFSPHFGRVASSEVYVGGRIDSGPCFWNVESDELYDYEEPAGTPEDCGSDHSAARVDESLHAVVNGIGEVTPYPLPASARVRSYSRGGVAVIEGATITKLSL